MIIAGIVIDERSVSNFVSNGIGLDLFNSFSKTTLWVTCYILEE